MNKADVIKKLNEHQHDLIIVDYRHIADWDKEDNFLGFGHSDYVDFNEDIQVAESSTDDILISDGECTYRITFGKNIPV